MELGDWDDLVDEFSENTESCLGSEDCVEELMAASDAGCFLCELEALDEDDE